METAINGSRATCISPDTVEEQLQRLRSSPLFSHSRRYPKFLDYVVRKTLEGQSDALKERIVGVEVFGRPSDYDLNADPVVRVTAGEVRKRLAQYYYEADHQHELRIEIRPGSYIPEFKLAGETWLPAAPAISTLVFTEPEPGRAAPLPLGPAPAAILPPVPLVDAIEHDRSARVAKWKSISAALAIALIAAVGIAARPLLRRESATDTFWRPVLDANGPVLISVGSVAAMVNGNAVAPPAYTVSGHPLASDPIAVSDATALSSIPQVLSTRSKASTLESSTHTSFSDLQKGPIVLISGFNNQWTVRLTEALRFHFVRTSTDDYMIQDRTDPANHQWDINTAIPFAKMDSDFGIVARFHDPTTEQVVIVAAGIGENGTVAAGRVLTDDKYLAELKENKLLPSPGQNFEAVVETQIIDGKPGPPRVVATHTW